MKRYCLDTNVFVEAWTKYYSMDLCPGYWEILDALAQEGRIFSSIEVKREIENSEDDLHAWVKERPHFFHEVTEEVQQCLVQVLNDHGRLVDSTKQRSMADPWVIAHAMAENAVVVTKEEASGSKKRIKIPDVCYNLGVPVMDDFEFLSEIGVRFDASRHEKDV